MRGKRHTAMCWYCHQSSLRNPSRLCSALASQIIIYLQCGASLSIASAIEDPTCVYNFVLTSPLACRDPSLALPRFGHNYTYQDSFTLNTVTTFANCANWQNFLVRAVRAPKGRGVQVQC